MSQISDTVSVGAQSFIITLHIEIKVRTFYREFVFTQFREKELILPIFIVVSL